MPPRPRKDQAGKALTTTVLGNGNELPLSTNPISAKKRGRSREDVPAISKRLKASPAINPTPSQRLNVFVFGAGENGELGLGPKKGDGPGPTQVTRPTLNKFLDPKTIGVVQIAVGGMHCVALTHDNRIVTWGVNDSGALGRDTTWEEPMRDIDNGSDSESDDADLSPPESTPTAIPAESFGKEPVQFVQVAASNSASFALTTDGHVYGWGTFQGSDGDVGFLTDNAAKVVRGLYDKTKKDLQLQRTPILLSHLKDIKCLAAGNNHVLALTNKGKVWSWGVGEQSQLGRRIFARTRLQALTPCPLGLSKIKYIATGGYNSFAINEKDQVLAWGANNYGQTGISGAGDRDSIVDRPTIVPSLSAYKITELQGGEHHSIACCADGTVLIWGRCDDGQAGIDLSALPPADLLLDSRQRPGILAKPTIVPDIHGVYVAAGSDNSFALTKDGEAYSWGFSDSYRTGQGTEDTIPNARRVKSASLASTKVTFAGCGGQFSVLAGPAVESTNGS